MIYKLTFKAYEYCESQGINGFVILKLHDYEHVYPENKYRDIIRALSFELKLTEMTANFDIYNWEKFQTKQLLFPNYVEKSSLPCRVTNNMLYWNSTDRVKLQDSKLLIMCASSTKLVDS